MEPQAEAPTSKPLASVMIEIDPTLDAPTVSEKAPPSAALADAWKD